MARFDVVDERFGLKSGVCVRLVPLGFAYIFHRRELILSHIRSSLLDLATRIHTALSTLEPLTINYATYRCRRRRRRMTPPAVTKDEVSSSLEFHRFSTPVILRYLGVESFAVIFSVWYASLSLFLDTPIQDLTAMMIHPFNTYFWYLLCQKPLPVSMIYMDF
jgi:hypothetical protein